MTAAEIWCWLNGWCWPGGRPAASEQEKAVIRLCMAGIKSVEADGLRLWRERCGKKLDPVSGGQRR